MRSVFLTVAIGVVATVGVIAAPSEVEACSPGPGSPISMWPHSTANPTVRPTIITGGYLSDEQIVLTQNDTPVSFTTQRFNRPALFGWVIIVIPDEALSEGSATLTVNDFEGDPIDSVSFAVNFTLGPAVPLPTLEWFEDSSSTQGFMSTCYPVADTRLYIRTGLINPWDRFHLFRVTIEDGGSDEEYTMMFVPDHILDTEQSETNSVERNLTPPIDYSRGCVEVVAIDIYGNESNPVRTCVPDKCVYSDWQADGEQEIDWDEVDGCDLAFADSDPDMGTGDV
ncbi:MAG: hypothetical protein KC561_16145, partial [Myxococcales bacterium]|nr:hypothetical protein [Myxococcales bacterium]